MDYSSILRQLVDLENVTHDFIKSWPEDVLFPTDIGDDYICEGYSVRKKTTPENSNCFTHGECLFKPIQKYYIDIGFSNVKKVFRIAENSGFIHYKEYWKDFSLENPTIPEIVHKARTIIHGQNWLDNIPVKIDCRYLVDLPSIGKKKL